MDHHKDQDTVVYMEAYKDQYKDQHKDQHKQEFRNKLHNKSNNYSWPKIRSLVHPRKTQTCMYQTQK